MRSVLLPMLGICALSACTTTINLAGVPERQSAAKAQPESRARVHTELAALYYQQGSFKTALDELSTAVHVDPGYAPAYSMYGLIYMQLGEKGQAAESFQKAIALSPSDPDIRNNYGLFLCQSGQPRAGLQQLELAWQNPLYATPGRALANASKCAATAGDTGLAKQYRQRAEGLGVSVDPDPAAKGTLPLTPH